MKGTHDASPAGHVRSRPSWAEGAAGGQGRATVAPIQWAILEHSMEPCTELWTKPRLENGRRATAVGEEMLQALLSSIGALGLWRLALMPSEERRELCQRRSAEDALRMLAWTLVWMLAWTLPWTLASPLAV